MLSTPNQLNAYKELSAAGGMATPSSVEKSSQASTSAAATGTELAGLILSTVQYPATISANTAQITCWATSLSGISKAANTHAQLLRSYSDPSALIQLSIGWDVYCRANSIEAVELPVSKAIADEIPPGKLLNALMALDTSALKAAMDAINTALAASGGADGAPLTSAQIKALSDAVTAFSPTMATASTAGVELNVVYEDAVNSCDTAQTAYSSAVSIALVNASVNDRTVASAITSITPTAVLNALKGGE